MEASQRGNPKPSCPRVELHVYPPIQSPCWRSRVYTRSRCWDSDHSPAMAWLVCEDDSPDRARPMLRVVARRPANMGGAMPRHDVIRGQSRESMPLILEQPHLRIAPVELLPIADIDETGGVSRVGLACGSHREVLAVVP